MYDLVVVLALKLGPNWKLTPDLITRLDYAVTLYSQQKTKRILVTGRWSIWYSWLGIKPPITEAMAMKRYLVSKGVPKSHILTEQYSKDTVGNIFALKSILHNATYASVALICGEPHLQRVRMLCDTILSTTKNITYIPIPSPNFEQITTGDEQHILAEQKAILTDVIARRHHNPHYRIYSHPYYQRQARQVKQLKAVEPWILRVHPSLAPDLTDHLLNASPLNYHDRFPENLPLTHLQQKHRVTS